MSWEAEFVSVVTFAVPGTPSQSALEVWKKLLPDREPDSFGRPRVPGPPQSQAMGPFGDYQLIVVEQGIRTEIRLAGPETPFDEGPSTLKDVVRTVAEAEKLGASVASAWPMNRLAIQVSLTEEAESTEAATRLIDEQLPFLQLSQEATAVLFQLNLRRKSSVEGVALNRLCKWGVAKQQLMSAHFTVGGDGAPHPVLLSERDIATYHLDINTVPRQDAYDGSEVDSLIAEIAEEARTLIGRGYEGLVQNG